MSKSFKTLLVIIIACFSSCNLFTDSTKPLIPKNESDSLERNNHLFVFVGEKIDSAILPKDEGSMDLGIWAKYKVLQRVYGDYDDDIIEFEAYDHYGMPAFLEYNHVLLFVSKYEGKYYLEKYQYNDVYKTKSGRWAGSYSIQDYSHPYNKGTKVKPEKIEFVEKVAYPVKGKYDNGESYVRYYPDPYFKTVDNNAIVIYGNYIEELFRLKKEGVLTARELFKNDKEEEEDTQVNPIEIKKDTLSKHEIAFRKFWKYFSKAIRKADLKVFKKLALDSLRICDSIKSLKNFMKDDYKIVFDKSLISKLDDSLAIRYSAGEADSSNLPVTTKQRSIKRYGIYNVLSVDIANAAGNEPRRSLYMNFIETKNGFRLSDIGYAGNMSSCIYQVLIKRADEMPPF